MIEAYFPKSPEYDPVLRYLEKHQSHCRIDRSRAYYTVVTSDVPILIHKRHLRMRTANWHTMFAGGLKGKIMRFDMDIIRVEPEDE
jgi:hypothetical protein